MTDIKQMLEDHKMWVLTEGKAGIKADFQGANLFGATLSDARGLLQCQGKKRICCSVKHDDCVMQKRGSFWWATDKALDAIRKKDSFYEKFLSMQVEALEGE
jgi:hypothetical protein